MSGKPKRGNYNFLQNYTYYVPGVGDMFVLLIWLLLGALLGNIINLLFVNIMGADAGKEYGMLVAYPVMFIPAMMFAAAKSRSLCFNNPGVKLDSSHFGRVGLAGCALIAIFSTLALSFCSDAVNILLPPMPDWLSDTLKGMTQGTLWINVVCVSIFAPLFEEWLCRGQILRGLLSRGIKPCWAIVISAVFFAVIHANPWQAVPALLLGGMFGFVYYKTGSLKLTMLMHCANNTLAVVCSNIESLKDMNTWFDCLETGEYWITFAVCALIIIVSIMIFAAIPLASPRGNCDNVEPLEDIIGRK